MKNSEYILNLKNNLKDFAESNILQSPKISVIVPAYNVESFIEECLTSIIKQSFRDFEIIIVNDGSTDSTPDIIDIFSKIDSRINVINQKNAGPSAARNNGIESAKGEYICFIDSDDWVDCDFLEKHYNAITKNNADISACTIIRWRPKNQKYRVHYTKEEIFTTLKDKIEICSIPKCCYVWNKLYKTSIVKKYKFKEGAYFEDILWTPEIIKTSDKLVTVPNTNYYYRANNNSIVKKQSKEKQFGSYIAKKYINNFFEENNLEVSKKQKLVTKEIKYLCGIPIIKIKEDDNFCRTLLFGRIPICKTPIPIIKNNTFIVWEPCSSSHSEVVPGYAKYLLDLGYHVSVIVNPKHYKDGLFSRFEHPNISYNKIPKKLVLKYFKDTPLDNIKGIMVTTAGKICDNIHFEDSLKTFYPNTNMNKLYLVEHDARFSIDAGTWNENIITLRKLNYKNYKSTVINPHYFGEVKLTPKNSEVVNFLLLGRLAAKRNKNEIIINAVEELHARGIKNFKVTVIGKGSLKGIPNDIKKYFDIKGRLPFDKMYSEIEKADFMLTSYDVKNPNQIFYNTTGTSGNFQLVYGFSKPCIIIKEFADTNSFTDDNSIIYNSDEEYADAMIKCLNMDSESYLSMQENIREYAKNLYNESLNNFKNLIERKTGVENA